MMLNKLLVPFDFSKHSDTALELAASLAATCDGQLLIVHVKEPLAVHQTDSKFPVEPYGDLDQLRSSLENVKPNDSTVQHQHWLFVGDVVDNLLTFAAEQDVDMIVMGTHGRTGFARAVVGSIADGVLRQASCPVLTVKHPEEREETE